VLTPEERERVARVRNSIVALARSYVYIYPATIMDVYEDSLDLHLQAKDILLAERLEQLTQRAASRHGQAAAAP